MCVMCVCAQVLHTCPKLALGKHRAMWLVTCMQAVQVSWHVCRQGTHGAMHVHMHARGCARRQAVQKLNRAIQEFQVRGIKTNTPFLLNVLRCARVRTGTYLHASLPQAVGESSGHQALPCLTWQTCA